MESTNSNLTSPSKPKSKFSANLMTSETNELQLPKRTVKKYSEDLTQSPLINPINQEKNSRLNEIKRQNIIKININLKKGKKFATLTPLMTPRTIQPSITNTLKQGKFAYIPSIPQTNFKKLCKLSNGHQSLNCYKCIDIRTNKIVVVKEIKNNDDEICEQFQAEYRFIKKLEHSNIVKAVELLNEADYCQLVMEYAEGKSLGNYIQKLDENQIIHISKQLFSALAYLHQKNIMHRDLHFNNIVYNKSTGDITILDFGIAKELRDKILGASCAGEINYRAPEMLCYQPYSCKIDCWQSGLMLLQLVNHKKTTSQRVMTKLQNSQPIIKSEISPKLSKLINSLLVINADNRISAEEALNLIID